LNRSKLAIMVTVPLLLLTISACSGNSGGNREVIKEPGKTITIINEDSQTPASEDAIVVGNIKKYEKMYIYGWLDEETVIVSKENETLEKMKLEELSDTYPHSLYQYNVITDTFTPLIEKENIYIGAVKLSPDNKHLVYQEYTIGDPSYHLLNLETLQTVNIPVAMSARWVDNDSVVGSSYAGGVYMATTSGEVIGIEEIKDDFLFLVAQVGDRLYYNTDAYKPLKVLDMNTKEIKELGFESASNITPSPDGTQLVVEYYSETKGEILLSGMDGENAKAIAEGAELGGISWSEDQRFIAYSKQDEINGAMVKGLYVYDLLTDESTRILANLESSLSTTWSPSGKELTYTVWNGSSYESSIIEIQAQLATVVDE
jgi:TolB protein